MVNKEFNIIIFMLLKSHEFDTEHKHVYFV